MAVAGADAYAEMLDRAAREGFAYPSVNVSSSETLVAALRGFAQAGSDGIISVLPGAAAAAAGIVPGGGTGDPFTGAVALAEYAHAIAGRYPVSVALHTDHCQADALGAFVEPLLALSAQRVAAGREPLYQSHMWDGSALPLAENLAVARRLLAASVAARTVLEIEIGIVRGEEEDAAGDGDGRFSTPADGRRVASELGVGEHGRYLLAAAFGNAHGTYQPGEVQLAPDVLGALQAEVGAAVGVARPFALVFHGGSSTSPAEIREVVSHGVVKMNLNSDTQYAFSRAVARFMVDHHDEVVGTDALAPVKRAYDPRAYLAAGEAAMAARVVAACEALGSAGRSLSCGA